MQLRMFSLLFAGAAAARNHKGFVEGLDSSKDTVREFVKDDMDAGLFSSAELSVGEALQSLDQDGDGGISKAEFQTHVDVKEITEYLAWLQGHVGEGWPTEPDVRFQFLDEDSSGHLDEDEQERAASMAEVSVLFSREAAQSNSSALDGTLAKKVEDPRCEGAREGFNCLAGKDLIYCTAGKRLGDQETCGWEGKCKRGILGSGGCDYHLCKGKVDGQHCGQSAGSKVVVQCTSKGTHGRIERESHKVNTCPHGGCTAFPDGPPPTRRRRTCNGGRTCSYGGCGNSYGHNSYGHNSYGHNSYGHNSYGHNSYGHNSFGHNSFGHGHCYNSPDKQDPPYARCN